MHKAFGYFLAEEVNFPSNFSAHLFILKAPFQRHKRLGRYVCTKYTPGIRESIIFLLYTCIILLKLIELATVNLHNSSWFQMQRGEKNILFYKIKIIIKEIHRGGIMMDIRI